MAATYAVPGADPAHLLDHPGGVGIASAESGRSRATSWSSRQVKATGTARLTIVMVGTAGPPRPDLTGRSRAYPG